MIEETKKHRIINTVLEQKKPLKEVAEGLYMTQQHLKLLLKSWGVELPKKRKYKRMPTPDRDSLMQLYKRYGTTQKVADHFGIGINTVTRWMKELKIPMRKMKMRPEDKVKFLEEHIAKLDI